MARRDKASVTTLEKMSSRKLKPLCHYHTSQDNFHLKQIQLLRPFSISEVSNRSWFYPNILLLPKIINQSNIVDGSRMKKDSRKFEKQFENKFLSHYQSKQSYPIIATLQNIYNWFHRIKIENIKQIFLQNALIKKTFCYENIAWNLSMEKFCFVCLFTVLIMQSTFYCIHQVHAEYWKKKTSQTKCR